ncbi:DUF1329 domain-containing protein [Pseudomonas sp. PS02288]|uniref:DUF1329 domain-containing protein n=1 Tax=Pseudomonas sp. PS02288 TaxID=2991443 RepID=UPI00249CCC00|nr:DUF1329 domain-containing protein [Pseudomonas sp. PS02288]
MRAKTILVAVATSLSLLSISTQAAVTPDQASQLGKTLTPLGAERAGNASGTIPEWTGGLTKPPADYKGPGSHHVDPFPSDKPLFTITKANVEQYKNNLTPGLIALINANPETFNIPIYQTRRTGAAPQSVYDNTLKNATTATLVADGNGFEHAYGGTPFPIPQNGVEALWNHIARYRGTYVVRRYSAAAVQRGGAYSLSSTQQEALFNFYDPNTTAETLNNILLYYTDLTLSPARQAGGSVLVHETLNQVSEPRQAWSYNSGQRRVRRAPGVAYDTPTDVSDGLRTVDDTDMFNGAPDRYDWKLLGKKEIYIPYNNYKISSEMTKYKDLLQPEQLNPAYTRFELHRVWVVEGTLKAGARHIYAKRTLYLDEDSWQAALIDQYDGRGELWRVSVAYLKNYYELPTTWVAAEVNYDLQARRYFATQMDSEEPRAVDFSQPTPDISYFKPAALRRRGVR